MSEKELYAPIMKALHDRFSSLGECYFEDTHKGFSEKLKDELDDYSLFILKVEKTYPDLTGFIIEPSNFSIVVVEIKKKPTLKDIYQTKRYAEILNASYGFLIAPKKLSPERRRFLIEKEDQITAFCLNKQVLIGLYDEATKSIHFDGELCSNMPIDEKHYNVIFGDLKVPTKLNETRRIKK